MLPPFRKWVHWINVNTYRNKHTFSLYFVQYLWIREPGPKLVERWYAARKGGEAPSWLRAWKVCIYRRGEYSIDIVKSQNNLYCATDFKFELKNSVRRSKFNRVSNGEQRSFFEGEVCVWTQQCVQSDVTKQWIVDVRGCEIQVSEGSHAKETFWKKWGQFAVLAKNNGKLWTLLVMLQ